MTTTSTDRDRVAAVLPDLDGTLVDSVYVQVIAWHDALAAAGHDVPMFRIHAAIGLGSDRLLPWLLGQHPPDAEDLSADHRRRFLARGDTLGPTPGARALLDDLERRGIDFAVSTSAGPDEQGALFAALGRDVPTVGSDDVAASKPAPDLLLAACDELGASPAQVTLIGDAPWDALAGSRAGIATIGVRCGGSSEQALRAAGAVRVVAAPADLVGTL